MSARTRGIGALLALLAGCGSPSCAGRPPAPTDAGPPAAPPTSTTEAGTEDEVETKSDDTSPLAVRIEELRRGGRRQVPYLPPTEAEERAYRAWVAAVARAAASGAEPPREAPEGFTLQRVEDLWVLAEQGGRRRGAGVVVLRPGAAAPLLVEAPHSFFDQGTLPVALACFREHRARALLVNTVYRYRSREAAAGGDDAEERSKDVPSDVAHAPSSFFLAAHEALLALAPGAAALQLHGFDGARVQGVDLILSAAASNADVKSVAARVRAVLGDAPVRTFPDEVRVLGGVTNVEAQSSRRANAPFVHAEMSNALRRRLVHDAELRRRFVAALAPIAAASEGASGGDR